MNAQQAPVSPARPTVSGKFFRLGEAKFYLKGLTYGPFRPDPDGQPFPNRPDTQRDFELIRRLGANCCAFIMCRRAGCWTWPINTGLNC